MDMMLKTACVLMLTWASVSAETCDVCMELMFEDGTYAEGRIPCDSPQKGFVCPEEQVCTSYIFSGKLYQDVGWMPAGQRLSYKIADCSHPIFDCDVIEMWMLDGGLVVDQCEKNADVWGIDA